MGSGVHKSKFTDEECDIMCCAMPPGVNLIAINKYVSFNIKMSSWILDLAHTILSLTGPH